MAKKPTGSKPTGSKKDAARRGASKHTAPKSATTSRPLPAGEAQVAAVGLGSSVPDQGVSPPAGTPESKAPETETSPPAVSAHTPRTTAAAQPQTDSAPTQAPAAARLPGGSTAGGETSPEPEPKTEPKPEQATPPARSSTPADSSAPPPMRPRPTRDPEPASKPAQMPLAEPEPVPEKPLAPPPEPKLASVPEPEYEQPREPEPIHAPAPPAPARPSLFIVHITPELASVAKVGGLADVVFGLSRELAIRGNHVEIILPMYATLRHDQIFEMHEVYKDLWVPWYDGAIHCTVFFGFVHGRKCFFIEPHSPENFFNRGSIYGFKDDVLRYAFFSRAAMEFLWKAGKHPDVIHVHDWQTALVPVFLYEFYQPLGMTHPRVCLTIHNFAHQGVTGVEILHATGLHRPERFFNQDRMADNTYPKALNLLKAGIVYSNFITTVSPRYAFETKDQGQGFGLEPTLHTHQMKYGGVVNGIDYDIWNPEVDHQIPVRYSVESIDGKYDNKRALRHRLMLADNEKPIVAFIGRLDPQKGLDLVRHAIFYTLERGAQFVLLGSSPDERINGDFWGLKRMLNDSPDCHLEIGFDEDLSHLIYAGADMMLVPSRFEPCGLTQLIALRYGTVPVVREVGGLADTVFDKDYSHRPLHERNGYVFRDFDNAGLESALGRAIACYHNHPEHFRDLMKNGMRSDYSWNTPGQDYLNIYDYIREG
ncbi:glycogen synthase [Thiocapsa roseopersicina]|uniref:Glycogen synthase n=1 Tax=Thiocapsa roseopersicina TaxID=1058 RepID=A0A1H2WVP6_THIRO|nr:glycogen synthase [Thiocapsa roseopersicina]SDW84635.1 starch synthase [Thiocapsa roseopersicina]